MDNKKQLEDERETTKLRPQGKLDEGDQAEPAHTEAEKLEIVNVAGC